MTMKPVLLLVCMVAVVIVSAHDKPPPLRGSSGSNSVSSTTSSTTKSSLSRSPSSKSLPTSPKSQMTTSGGGGGNKVPPATIREALLTGDQAQLNKLPLPKDGHGNVDVTNVDVMDVYKPIQYLIGIKAGQQFPNRCYRHRHDHGIFTKIVVGRTLQRAKPSDSILTMLKYEQVSKVGKIVDVCQTRAPLSENGHLVLRQDSYTSCGGTNAVMVAYDRKECDVQKICNAPSTCMTTSKDSVSGETKTEGGVAVEVVRDWLRIACGTNLQVDLVPPNKFDGLLTASAYDIVILYKGHFLSLTKTGGQVLLRDSFCGVEARLTRGDEEEFLGKDTTFKPEIIQLVSGGGGGGGGGGGVSSKKSPISSVGKGFSKAAKCVGKFCKNVLTPATDSQVAGATVRHKRKSL